MRSQCTHSKEHATASSLGVRICRESFGAASATKIFVHKSSSFTPSSDVRLPAMRVHACGRFAVLLTESCGYS